MDWMDSQGGGGGQPLVASTLHHSSAPPAQAIPCLPSKPYCLLH